MIYIKESFSSGYALTAVEKLAAIFSRKMKTQVLFAKTPFAYQNTYGKFNGFYFNLSQKKKRFRINFLLNKSDSIYSVDFYDSSRMRDTPNFTVDTMGLNIIQIVDLIYDELENFSLGTFEELPESIIRENEMDAVIAGGGAIYSYLKKGDKFHFPKNTEIMTKSDGDWYIDSEGRKFKTGSKTSIVRESIIRERGYIPNDRSTQLFDGWVNDKKSDALEILTTKKMEDAYKAYLKAYKDNGEVPLYKFTQLAKAYIFSKGLTNPTFRKRKKGSNERPIEDQAKADELADLVDAMTWEKKFDMIEKSVDAVSKGQIQCLILFGSPGSGKTETVKQTLKKFDTTYLYLSGGLKSGDDLFNILKKHNKDEIIVMDDFDAAFKNRDMVDILKAALQNQPEREIAWRDKILTFTSGIIFISNMVTFDAAILSRAYSSENRSF